MREGPFNHIVCQYVYNPHNLTTLADDHPRLNTDFAHYLPESINISSTVYQGEESESALRRDEASKHGCLLLDGMRLVLLWHGKTQHSLANDGFKIFI